MMYTNSKTLFPGLVKALNLDTKGITEITITVKLNSAVLIETKSLMLEDSQDAVLKLLSEL